jgi:tryptophan-rich sensory protein
VNRIFSLILFIVFVLGTGLVLGGLTVPGGWYADLVKPTFNPPAWLFGPVWTVLYVLIAIAGWITWGRDRTGRAMQLWWMQMLLNFLWTPIYFGMHQIGLALVVILLLLASIIAFIVAAWRSDRVSARIFVPYAAWVAFASVLNASILVLN